MIYNSILINLLKYFENLRINLKKILLLKIKIKKSIIFIKILTLNIMCIINNIIKFIIFITIENI